MYPYFLMGSFFSKYAAFKDKVLYSNHLFTIAIIGYILCLMYQNEIPVNLNYTGCFAIIILINMFVKYNQYIPEKLSFIGKCSLEIYVFHWFLLPTLNNIGYWVSSQSLGFNENFIILFCITLIIAMPIIGICIILSKIIQNSRFLNAVCLGSFK
jgi:peptidoglycan/LPS O-acetylase OafA/YrhL